MEAKLKDIVTPWVDPKDQLDREKYAGFLTNYLSQKNEQFVLNLDAPWGMGKTYFITHWYRSLEGVHPAVYINAWETDFSDDPFITVISALHDQLGEYLPKSDKDIEAFSKKLKSGGRFLKTLAPIIGKGLLKKALGSEEGKELLDNINLSGDMVTDISEKSMSILLENQSEAVRSMEQFTNALGELIQSIEAENEKLPVFLYLSCSQSAPGSNEPELISCST